MLIRPLMFHGQHSAFELARLFYAQYPELDFGDDLVDYMRNGFVITRPQLFVMAKVIHRDDGHLWFCRIAIGNLIELLTVMPFYLPRIAFCRNGRADKMRICSTNRLTELAVRNAIKKENPSWAAAAA